VSFGTGGGGGGGGGSYGGISQSERFLQQKLTPSVFKANYSTQAQLILKYSGSFLAVRRPEHETKHLHPSGAKVKNQLSYFSTPPYAFIERTSTNLHSDLPFPRIFLNIHHIKNRHKWVLATTAWRVLRLRMY
jgi:hypothetical protein